MRDDKSLTVIIFVCSINTTDISLAISVNEVCGYHTEREKKVLELNNQGKLLVYYQE